MTVDKMAVDKMATQNDLTKWLDKMTVENISFCKITLDKMFVEKTILDKMTKLQNDWKQN